MRRLTAFLAPFVVALATASASYATLTHVSSTVQVLHGSTVVATYSSVNPSNGSALFPCATGGSCTTTVPLSSRDFGRVIKFCDGNNFFTYLIQAAATRGVTCSGKPDWLITINSTLWDCSGASCVQQIGPIGTLVTVNIQPSKALG